MTSTAIVFCKMMNDEWGKRFLKVNPWIKDLVGDSKKFKRDLYEVEEK